MSLEIVGILLSLLMLMYFAYRGISVLVLAPLMAMTAVLFHSDVSLMGSLSEVFMTHFAQYAKKYFLLFLLGSVFGSLMQVSGFARTIASFLSKKLGADHAITSIVLSCAILTYGGVSLFVVAFAVFPIAYELFKEADIPTRLIPGSIALGSFTFTMTALPGSPQIQNSIPIPFFGTDTFAAPVIGSVSAAIMSIGGIAWLRYRSGLLKMRGEGFEDVLKLKGAQSEFRDRSYVLSFLPIFIVLVGNFYFSKYFFPTQDLSYLESAPYLTSSSKVIGLWSIIVSLIISILFIIVSNLSRVPEIISAINSGAKNCLLAIVNTCSEVGYGNVIASLSSFVIIKNGIIGVSSNVLISEALSVTSLAGITGSASGGLSIALGALGETFLSLGGQNGISPEVLHRVATIACGGLDSLPHNGAVITLLGICSMTHKKSYFDIGVTSVVIPLLALIVAIAMGSIGII